MSTEEPGRRRLTSLDAFRGITIAGMILVNNPGRWGEKWQYAQLRHAAWDGWTATDLVFPFFLFIVGTAMALSFRRREESRGRAALWVKVIRRSLLLFLVGLLLSGFWEYRLDTLRIPGVLQRIAACYLVVSLINLALPPLWQWLAMGGLMAAWVGIMLGLPVPEHGTGALTLEGNAGSYLDRLVLGSQHLWKKVEGFDPEGILSTTTAAWNTFLGLVFGRVLLRYGSHVDRLSRWLALAALLTAAGALLSLWLPVNKPIWSPSYALLTSGLAGFSLVICYAVMEILKVERPLRPFVMLGMNALVLFCASGLLARTLGKLQVSDGSTEVPVSSWIFEHGFLSWLSGKPASLAYALANVLLFLLIAAFLYRRRWFVRL